MNQMKWVTWALLAFVVFAVLLGFALLSRASAQDDRRWLPRKWEGRGYYYHNPKLRRPKSYYKGIEDIIVQEESGRFRCLGRLYSDKGRELASEEGALKDAERSWASLIREERGEKYMDLRYAQRYESRCQRASTGESATSKVVGGITETFTGKDYTVLYRCRIYAEPCTAPRVTDDKVEK